MSDERQIVNKRSVSDESVHVGHWRSRVEHAGSQFAKSQCHLLVDIDDIRQFDELTNRPMNTLPVLRTLCPCPEIADGDHRKSDAA